MSEERNDKMLSTFLQSHTTHMIRAHYILTQYITDPLEMQIKHPGNQEIS